jgi:hypothetical protein
MSRSFDPSSRMSSEPGDAIPSKLADGFAELYAAPRVPASFDSAILNAARAHLAGQAHRKWSAGFARHSRLLRWAGAGAAAAAAVAAVLLITIRPHTAPQVTPHPAIAGDINGDGRVDILDAYLVARKLADKSRTSPLPAAWDVNHDGVVDQKDVAWIANAAVRVGNGGVAAGDSKLARSSDVFRLAENLKSIDGPSDCSKVAILLPSTKQRGIINPENAHGACTVGPAPQAIETHGASTVGVPARSWDALQGSTPRTSQSDATKGAAAQ